MNDLITRAIQENQVSILAELPPELMGDEDQKLVDYILAYNRKFSQPPSLKKLIKKFGFVPFYFEESEWEPDPPPVGDILQETIQKRLVDETNAILRQVNLKIREEGKVPLELLSEIDRLHVMSLGASRYSAFDRELYFRRKAMDFPFKLINKKIGGLCNGDFFLLIGRLGTGKSTITQYIAKVLWEEGKRILFISAEMLGLDVFSRIDGMVGSFNPLELRKPKTDEIEKTLKQVEKISSKGKGEIIVPKTRILSPDQIATFAKNLEVDLIIVDGCYLLRPSQGKFSSKWERVATVSNELKQVCLDLDLPIIGTAQIKRGATKGEKYDPEDIAFSDALGQDADFVLAISQNAIMPERKELQLIKNRYGSEIATQITADFDTMTITDDSVVAPTTISMEEWSKEPK